MPLFECFILRLPVLISLSPSCYHLWCNIHPDCIYINVFNILNPSVSKVLNYWLTGTMQRRSRIQQLQRGIYKIFFLKHFTMNWIMKRFLQTFRQTLVLLLCLHFEILHDSFNSLKGYRDSVEFFTHELLKPSPNKQLISPMIKEFPSWGTSNNIILKLLFFVLRCVYV